jgi:hypothetical protein
MEEWLSHGRTAFGGLFFAVGWTREVMNARAPRELQVTGVGGALVIISVSTSPCLLHIQCILCYSTVRRTGADMRLEPGVTRLRSGCGIMELSHASQGTQNQAPSSP